jgi:hypothetical protein
MGKPAAEVLGVAVEPAAPPPPIADPIVDAALPGGRTRLVAVRDRAVVLIDGIGSFEIEGGRRVRFAPEAGASLEAAGPWLEATVPTLLLAQRAQFALHASVVDVGGAAVAISGVRGAGKSTTALRLTQRGHALVTDDVSVLIPGDEVSVHPLARPVRVFPETAERLGLDTSGARRIPSQAKVALPAPAGAPLPLAAVAVLAVEGGAVTSTRLHGAAAAWAIVENTHRGGLYRSLWEREMFEWAGQVAACVPVHQVTRPDDRWSVDEVADAVAAVR